MSLFLWLLGLLIVAMLIRQLLLRAPKNGKPFLLRVVIILILMAALIFAIKGLIPATASLLGGLLLYARPVLNALGLWQMWSRNKKAQASQAHEQNPNQNPNKTGMDITTARKILDVSEDASEEDIMLAYKVLMAKNHPDRGGSGFLATQINQARDVLLNDLQNR